MNNFITINGNIINKNLIKEIEIERDVEKTVDYDYPDGLRTTDIYIKIITQEKEYNFTIFDDDFCLYVNFIKDFFDIEDYNTARNKAINIMQKSKIKEYK